MAITYDSEYMVKYRADLKARVLAGTASSIDKVVHRAVQQREARAAPAAIAPLPAAAAPSMAMSYRPPAPAPKPAEPLPLSNAALRARMDSVLWQDSVRGRERLALALIAEPAIQADGILPALRAAPALRDEQSRKLSARIGDLACCANSMGRERLTLHLIEQTHHSVDAVIGMLRAAARDTSAKAKTESTTELYARRAAERATARRQ